MHLPKPTTPVLTALLAVSITATSSVLQAAESVKEMFTEAKPSLNVRARYEYVDGVGGAGDVNGLGLQTRLGLTSGKYNGVNLMLEVENLSFEDGDDRPSLDVPTTEVNQLYAAFEQGSLSGKVGRQVYVLDDHRFLGHVGWRMNMQSFDAVTVAYAPEESSFKLNLGYVDQVNRINATAQGLEGIVINGSYQVADPVQLGAFYYSLDFESASWAGMDTGTAGLRANGSLDLGIALDYAASYARQSDHEDNPNAFDHDYFSIDFSTNLSGLKLGLGYESMAGDGVSGFTTPLATVHKFAGFADVFAGRSIGLSGGLPQGLDDFHCRVGYELPVGSGLPLTVIYHRFEAENAGGDLGDELDVVGSYKLTDYATLVSKYAYYEPEADNSVGYGASKASMFSFEVNLKF